MWGLDAYTRTQVHTCMLSSHLILTPAVATEHAAWHRDMSNSHCSTFLRAQVINCLDIFCGCGGLSFMAASDGGGSDPPALDPNDPQPLTRIEPRWAVDFNASACASYQVNHPNTHVSGISCRSLSLQEAPGTTIRPAL